MKTLKQSGVRRFGWVLRSRPKGDDPDFDVDLLRAPSAALTPTRGSILPGWSLLVPREDALSFAALSSGYRMDVLSLRQEIVQGMASFEGDVAWFEHGAAKAGSPVGCGVDQAHLHAVPLEFDLVDTVLSECVSLRWVEVCADDPFKSVSAERDYYYVSHAGRHLVSYPARKTPQYFRRLIARKLGMPTRWNYHEFEGRDEARRTVAAYKTGC